MSCYRCFWKERYYWCLLTSRLQLTNLYSDFVFQSSHVKSHLNVITTVSLKALGNKACHQQHYQYQEQTTLGARLRLMGRVTVRTKYNTGTWRQLEWAVTNKRLQAQQTSRSLLIRTGDKYREGTGQQPGYVRVRIIQIYLASGSHWSWRLVRRSVLPTMALDMPPDMHCLRKNKKPFTMSQGTPFFMPHFWYFFLSGPSLLTPALQLSKKQIGVHCLPRDFA